MTDDVFARWVLRKAAGCYWLVDTAQPPEEYRPPLRFNAVGAQIWTRMAQGDPPEEIAAALAAQWNTPLQEAVDDVREFAAQLEKELG